MYIPHKSKEGEPSDKYYRAKCYKFKDGKQTNEPTIEIKRFLPDMFDDMSDVILKNCSKSKDNPLEASQAIQALYNVHVFIYNLNGYQLTVEDTGYQIAQNNQDDFIVVSNPNYRIVSFIPTINSEVIADELIKYHEDDLNTIFDFYE